MVIIKIKNKKIKILKNNLKKDIKLIEDTTDVVNELRKGNLEKRLKEFASSKELIKLKKIINKMIDSLEDRIVAEISEKTKQEKLLIQQSKLAAMGNMIGNIAHQWRQPLSEINAILIYMQAKKESDNLSDKDFNANIQECDIILSHMSKTITAFQNFFKPSKEKSIFSLKDECKKASYIIESSLKYNNINFEINIKEDCEVFGYPREFSQAILNILSNAKDVLVERRIEEPYMGLTLKKGRKYALVKIEDNGGGISKNIMNRIFEPYFTTKHPTQGTGIGLYMSKIIIEENMHGHIDIKNNTKGAVFTIKLMISKN
ncbi:MAG: ATP-binding protein [Sulfurospirillum sp.]